MRVFLIPVKRPYVQLRVKEDSIKPEALITRTDRRVDSNIYIACPRQLVAFAPKVIIIACLRQVVAFAPKVIINACLRQVVAFAPNVFVIACLRQVVAFAPHV
jgi:hypothetical protein